MLTNPNLRIAFVSSSSARRLRVELGAALPRPVQPPVPGLRLQPQPQRPARRQAADRDSGHYSSSILILIYINIHNIQYLLHVEWVGT